MSGCTGGVDIDAGMGETEGALKPGNGDGVGMFIPGIGSGVLVFISETEEFSVGVYNFSFYFSDIVVD